MMMESLIKEKNNDRAKLEKMEKDEYKAPTHPCTSVIVSMISVVALLGLLVVLLNANIKSYHLVSESIEIMNSSGTEAKETLKDDFMKKRRISHQNTLPNFSSHTDVSKRNVQVLSSVVEVQQTIKDAVRRRKIIRVVGSKHSVKQSIFPNKDGVLVRLEGELRKLSSHNEVLKDDKKYLRVRVGAGCNIGVDPGDPTSNENNSFAKQVNDLGYALPNTGGIIHQTLGGFLSTGSAGGSLKYSFANAIQDIEFVNGKGELIIAKRGEPIWLAVGVSMGLMGIITHMTFELPQRFYIDGEQITRPFADSMIGFDRKGKSMLKTTLNTTEYFRALWFPQQGVQKVQEWSGKRAQLKGKVRPLKNPFSNPLFAFGAGLTLYETSFVFQKKKLTPFDAWIIKSLLNTFEPNWEEQKFLDIWYKALPQDNAVPSKTIFPVDFTEIWLPMDQCHNVMTKLNKMFADPKIAGNFATEIYGAKESPFWLGMSHGGPRVRIDVFWYRFNRGNIRNFFRNFWKKFLTDNTARLHWGKYLPLPGERLSENVRFDLNHLKRAYPNMEKWLAMREIHDPNNVFLNDYWKKYFEIVD